MYKIVLFVFVLLNLSDRNTVAAKRVCVIGAGVAGLASARYLKEEGINFTVLESTRYVGGTWRYDPRVGTDENGLPLHTSMYSNLRTNLPKPTMEMRGFPLPD
ncbi:senecionine N-oxygenase-like, partial [Manduca sexta]|uniref:senecionine N-oxygenase-like n=1 Tax=Manduca sexta TaxID=7130 RepID=UPI00188F3552